jgi:excisionase family DNA binding protein
VNVPPRLTIAEAAEITGRSKRAIEGRIERGSLEVVREGRRRLIPLRALYDSGLLVVQGGDVIATLVDRIEALARRVGELEQQLREREGD